MRQQARRSTSARSSSVNNYDVGKMAQRLNESFAKATEDAWQEELSRQIEDELTKKLTEKFTKHFADAYSSLEKTMKKQLRKSESKYHRIMDFLKCQRAGSSLTVPPHISQFEEETDDDEDDETLDFGDDSTHP